jgi:hypothetical protein
VMRELGIDISGHRSKSVGEFADQNFDYVLTVAVAALALGFLAYRHVTEEPPRVLKMFVRAASGQGGVSGEQSSSRFARWTQAGFRRCARRQRSALGPRRRFARGAGAHGNRWGRRAFPLFGTITPACGHGTPLKSPVAGVVGTPRPCFAVSSVDEVTPCPRI